jgi:hypothetical protein
MNGSLAYTHFSHTSKPFSTAPLTSARQPNRPKTSVVLLNQPPKTDSAQLCPVTTAGRASTGAILLLALSAAVSGTTGKCL